ncbi:MAG: SEC-C metal-binding domain-containing protein [Acidobacteriota bacterium]
MKFLLRDQIRCLRREYSLLGSSTYRQVRLRPSELRSPFSTSASGHSSRTFKHRPGLTHVKRGDRVVHGDKELDEKLGRNDPCPCLSGRRFQALLPEERALRRLAARPLLSLKT